MLARALSATMVISVMWCVSSWAAESAEPKSAEPPESAVSSPPMEMDDPGTPGPRGIEVNLVGSMARVGPGRSTETLFDANYGIGDRLQLKFERPYVTESADGTTTQKGLGATEFGIKWRFIERNGLEIAAYPQYELNDAFTLKDEEGNPEPSAGSSFYLPLLFSESVKNVYTLAWNIGYRRNLENRGDDVNLAVGAGWAVSESARLLAEVFSERDEHLDNRQTDVRVGYYGTLFGKWLSKSSFELDDFASVGHSIGATEEGESSTSFTLGVSVIRKPQGE